MAGNIKGITIEFNGDTTKLGKALSNVNKEIRTTDSALREVDKALKLDPSNVELLAQKEELLAKQVEQTKDKLELQKRAAEEAGRALAEGTISQEEYAKLSAQVATTSSKLEELQSSASGASGELQETGEAVQEAGSQAEDASSSFVDWSAVVSSACDMALTAITAVVDGIKEATTALVDMSTETADYADNILTLSSTSGVASDTLQALAYGEDLLDVSVGTVTGSITKLVKAMGNAQASEQEWQDSYNELAIALSNGEITLDEYAEGLESLGNSGTAFSELGIDILDASGNLRDSEDVFWDVIDALGQIDNETERDATAMSLLGRSARELNPLIEAGSEGFREIYNEAEQAGAIMSGDALESFDAFNDNLSRLDQGTQAAERALGGILMPVLDELASEGVTLLSDFTNGIINADGDIEAMGEVISQAVAGIGEILNGDLVGQMLEIGGAIIQTLAETLLANMDSILQMGFNLLMTILQGIVDNLGSLAPVVTNMVLTLVNFLTSNLPTVVSSAVQIIVAITEGLAEAMPELIPAIVDCVITICGALIDNLPEIIGAAQELFFGIIEGLLNATPDILMGLVDLKNEILESLMELALELPDRAMEWGIDMINGFIQGIQSMIGNLGNAVGSVADTIASYLHFSVPEKGALSDMDVHGGRGLIENFIEGMDSADAELQRALFQQSAIINNGFMPNDYSSQLAGISSQLAGIGGSVPQVINLYIGNQRFASAVVGANATENLRTGGI